MAGRLARLVAFDVVEFSTVTFATLEDLDVRLATGTASLSLLGSLVLGQWCC